MVASKRDQEIDIAKAIGIILVVIGHTKFKYGQIIYQFHLPLFFFLSGLVFNPQKLKNPAQFIYRRMKGLYLPFVVFELVFLLFHNFFWKIGFYSAEFTSKGIYSVKEYVVNFIKIILMGYGEQLAGPLWFLISQLEIAFLFAVLHVLICKVCMKWRDIVLIITCLLLYFVGCNTNLPRMFSQSLIGMLFYCFGFLYREYKNRLEIKWQLALISVVIIFISYRFNYVDISALDSTHGWALIISGICGTYFVLWISKCVSCLNKNIVNSLCYVGRNTIFILALHLISFKIISIIQANFYSLDWSIVAAFPTFEQKWFWFIPYSIVGVLVPVFVKWVIDVVIKFSRRRF